MNIISVKDLLLGGLFASVVIFQFNVVFGFSLFLMVMVASWWFVINTLHAIDKRIDDHFSALEELGRHRHEDKYNN